MQITNVVHQKERVDPTIEERKFIVSLVEEDRLAEATKYSESLIVNYPRSFVLFYTLGMSYTLLDEDKKAHAYLEKAVELNPEHANAWRYMGECCLALERHDEARTAFDNALRLDPLDKDSRRGMIQATVDPKYFKDSITKLEELVKDDPDNPNFLIALGQCYLEEEHYNRAISCLEKAAGKMPEDAIVLMLVGAAYSGFHKPKVALEWFKRAAELEAPRPRLLMMMATAAKDDGDFDQSIAWAEEAIELNPEGSGPKNNLAHIYTILGDTEKADALRAEVLKANAEDIGAIMGRANSHKVEKGEAGTKLLEKIHKREPEDHFHEKMRMNIGFTLGKIYGDTGQYSKAIDVLKSANAKRRELLGFDLDDEFKQFDLIRHVFDPISPADYTAPKPGDRRMIFILGMPRSGTTLTEQIISSHSQVYGAGELNFMNEETGELMYYFGLQPEVKLEKIAFDHIRPKYLEHIESLGMEERVITDKLPHNFLRLGYILCCFPESPIIHLKRDPVAVCLSCFQKFFPARGMGFTFGMRDLGLYYGKYLELMDYWRQKFPGRILDLDYKTLTENQESQTRMLLDHCALPWEDRCLEFYKTPRGVLTASQLQVRQKMYQGSSETWKKYRKHIGELLEALDEAGVEYDRA